MIENEKENEKEQARASLRLAPRLQPLTCRLVLIHTGEPVSEQGALYEVLCGRTGSIQAHGSERIVDFASQTECAARHGDALRFHLCLIADRLFRSNRVQHARLRARCSELAAADRVRPQSMAQTVGELEGQGFVTRRPDPLDGRRTMIELNEEGRTVLQADRALREGWLARAISQDLASADQRTLQEAVDVLRRLADSS